MSSRTANGPPFFYSGFGLRIRSDLHLPELRPRTSSGNEIPGNEVAVYLADVPVAREEVDSLGSFVDVGRREIRVQIPGIGSFVARDGREIFVAPAPNANIEDVRSFLLGGVFAAVWHQRDLFPLHASAVLTPQGAVAFVGESGAGKSTMALHLNEMGYPLLCDDVCVISRGPHGEALAWPGVNKLKLWLSSLRAAGHSEQGLRKVTGEDNKFHLPTSAIASDEGHELKQIHMLAKSADGLIRFRRLYGADSVAPLISHTYRGMVLRSMHSSSRHLSRAVEIAGRTRVWELSRPWQIESARSVCDEFERHLQDG